MVDRLSPDQSLTPGQHLVSSDGGSRLEFQGDGNLVLYVDDGGTSSARWASNTWGQPAALCAMQGDGNLVIYSVQGQPLWASNTWGRPGAGLVVQDDENVVIYWNGQAVWATNTWSPTTPLEYVHCYRNSRPDIDWNTCGIAAIGTILDFWNVNPFPKLLKPIHDAQDGKSHWNDGEIIDRLVAAGFGPDVIFGWGTTGGRIRDALTNYGLHADVGHSGLFSAGWEGLWNSLQDYLRASRPVPAMIDTGAIGGPSYGVHWAIAYRLAHDRIYLGNCPWNPSPTIQQFQDAWHCWFLPYGFNHCAVYC